MKLVVCKDALNLPLPLSPVVYTTDCSKVVVPVLHLLCVALWFILYSVLPCLLSFCISVFLALRSPRLGKRELVYVFFVHLFILHLMVCVLFSLPFGVRNWLRLVTVALPGLFCLSVCLSPCL